MHLFYNPQLDLASVLINQYVTLPEEEAQHAIRVLRLKEGEIIHITDGKGHIATSKITTITKKEVISQVLLIEKQEKRHFRLVACVAPTKNAARFEWFLEKATEMGIDEIYPIICDHSERKSLNIERTTKVITAAVKQSLSAFHPILHPAIKASEAFNLAFDGKKIVAHLSGDIQQKSLKTIINPNENIMVFIGPEGDFSKKEIEVAKRKSMEIVHLGSSRLRTETAALVACFTVNLTNQQ